MRIGQPPEQENNTAAKGQNRLISLIMAFCLVLVLMQWASQPESWHWLLPSEETVTDTKVAPALPGVGEDGSMFLHTPGDGSAPAAPRFNPNQPATPNQLGMKPSFKTPPAVAAAALPAEWLEGVDDQQLGIKAAESDAYYRVLAHVSRLDTRYAEDSSRGDVLHVNLIRDPNIYRGQLVTIQGIARRIQQIPVNENIYGIRQVYEVWLTTQDSDNDLWRVVTTQLDPALPQGEQVSVAVRLTGYFFKQYSYASQSGLHIAPLLLAANVAPYTIQKAAPSGTGLEPYLLAVAVITCVIAIFAVFVYSEGDRIYKDAMLRQFPLENAETDQFIKDLKNKDVKPGMFD